MPWDMIPMRTSSIYHDFHHSGGDFSGNFSGQMTIWDTIWGTNKVYYKKYVAQMEEKLFGKKI
jgi:sterol desaturase/sphingolipid hydroxylase (fatty acid hydroxylase superfamily)